MKINHELFECQGCLKAPCVPCVEQRFSAIDEYRMLEANDPRYGNWLWENKKKFREWFGDDVDPVEHGRHQAEHIAIPFIEFQDREGGQMFTDREAKLLVLTNLVHDYHEGITGDVPYTNKTVDSDKQELRINQDVLHKFMDGFLVWDVGQVMGDFEGKTFVGRAFDAVEKLGYFETGVKAWLFKDHQALSVEEKGKCYSMGLNVIKASVESLQKYRDEFPYINYLFAYNAKALREIGCS